MGWFEEQIEYRKQQDDEALSEAFQSIASSVMGYKVGSLAIRKGEDAKDAISELLRAFHVKEKELPPGEYDLEGRLNYLLSTSGIMHREIHLDRGWHKDGMGAMIGELKADGAIIAILQNASGAYCYTDPHTGKKVKVNARTEKLIGDRAYVFYQPFPQRAITMKDLTRYMTAQLTPWDLVSFLIASLLVTLVGLLIPKLDLVLFGQVVDYGSYQLLYAVVGFLLAATIVTVLIEGMKELILNRLKTKMDIHVQAATMMRILSMPADFFKNYSSGELNQYLGYLNYLCTMLVESVFSIGVTGLFSLVYIFQISRFASGLVVPALCITLSTLAFSVIAALRKMSISRKQMELAAKESGLIFSFLSGIQKIRLSGSEKRAFTRWGKIFAERSYVTNYPPKIVAYNSVLINGIGLIGTIVMYYTAVKTNVSPAEYYAFTSSYAYVTTAFAALAGMALSVATVKPILEIVKPLMDAEPEVMEGREIVTSLSGNIELSHVTFKYEEDGPSILDDMSLTIKPRQYVAIVGRTGCGKSTLIRLLLGFEKPQKGAIYFDRKDMNRLDVRSLRKKIGIVLQDGKLFGGSLFENISISAPNLTLAGAWEAAEVAGLKEVIEQMPMGMNTLIQEGGGGISGGQRQRVMIARAVAPKPKILILDEATSALDNITQKHVAEALDKMNCTRIVIAHRLSTIRHCDRILVLDKGKIVEDGNYDELIEKNGIFAELVARQRIDLEEEE